MQKTLNGEDLTPLKRLEQLRMHYYEEYCQNIRSHIIFLKQQTETYKNVVKELDKQIEKEKRKTKIKSSEV